MNIRIERVFLAAPMSIFAKSNSSGDIISELKNLHEQGWQIVGLENNIDKPTFELGSRELKEALSDNIVLILGEEVKGIDHSLYEIIDLFVEIPMKGQKESFNVSVAAGIALYGLINTKFSFSDTLKAVRPSFRSSK